MTNAEGELRLWRRDRLTVSDGNPYRIERADPVARIHAEMLQEAENAGEHGNPYVTFKDDVLTIRAGNRTVVYVVERDQYDAATDSYRMRWPD